jgi:hypothetical protein
MDPLNQNANKQINKKTEMPALLILVALPM